MLQQAERRYKIGQTLRTIASDLGVSGSQRVFGRAVCRSGDSLPPAQQVREMQRPYEIGKSVASVLAQAGADAEVGAPSPTISRRSDA